jgi:hypothetical protein
MTYRGNYRQRKNYILDGTKYNLQPTYIVWEFYVSISLWCDSLTLLGINLTLLLYYFVRQLISRPQYKYVCLMLSNWQVRTGSKLPPLTKVTQFQPLTEVKESKRNWKLIYPTTVSPSTCTACGGVVCPIQWPWRPTPPYWYGQSLFPRSDNVLDVATGQRKKTAKPADPRQRPLLVLFF